MFRNPRERDVDSLCTPSVGRPPSPQGTPARQIIITMPGPVATATPLAPKSTAKFGEGIKKSPVVKANGRKGKPNGSILNFFKKVDAFQAGRGLFLDDDDPRATHVAVESLGAVDQELPQKNGLHIEESNAARYNESGEPVKRRKLSLPETVQKDHSGSRSLEAYRSNGSLTTAADAGDAIPVSTNLRTSTSPRPREPHGPFLDDSDTDDDDGNARFAVRPSGHEKGITIEPDVDTCKTISSTSADDIITQDHKPNDESECDGDDPSHEQSEDQEVSKTVETMAETENEELETPTHLRHEATSYPGEDEFDDGEGLDEYDDDEYVEGEEFSERRWMREQRRLELEVDGIDGEPEDDDLASIKQEPQDEDEVAGDYQRGSTMPNCPVCDVSLDGVSDSNASVHVNNCLDGNPTPLPPRTVPEAMKLGLKSESSVKTEDQEPSAGRFRRPFRPAKPGQESPFMLGKANGTSSAFSKLMSGHAEDEAWAVAAAAEHAARGKPAYQRTCPFYKILPGFYTCVDAFRYGAVKGCNAYFLSHFHSDHYIGLTSTWCHGPIYCSRPTANLVKQQLRVDPMFVIPVKFEEKFEIPGTDGVFCTMIPANHCPGSSIYLFEKEVGKGKAAKTQRVLHCGDFRACPAHVEHPLLKPDVIDMVTGTTQQQKIDVCYLDTTYLNPRYAFPSQEDVIQACADMCVSMNKTQIDATDGWEQMKRDRAGGKMTSFVRVDSKEEDTSLVVQGIEQGGREAMAASKSDRGRLLVVVGTYSIGKERICLGIARALKSKIYAPPGKQRICAALEDKELNSYLTGDPRAAQVHMTPLFEIRADTLGDYLAEYSDRFSRAVGFRPSGWNYRPPGSRFTESPAVGTVLYSDNWKSGYGMRDLAPQRGSTSRSACYGVPYSEHSSFRELTMFCCALRIDRIIPTVNVGSAKGREKMKVWCERWAVERKKNGLFKVWAGEQEKAAGAKNEWYPGKGTWELRTTL